MAWGARSYRREEWKAADPINRALSAANSCLYGVCHAAIVSRELGIPCVVGTGSATSRLRDGELVTVDATHGVVLEGAEARLASRAVGQVIGEGVVGRLSARRRRVGRSHGLPSGRRPG